jgi:hypothetical protein
MLAVLNIYRYLLWDLFEDKGLISWFKHSKFGIDICHKYDKNFTWNTDFVSTITNIVTTEIWG